MCSIPTQTSYRFINVIASARMVYRGKSNIPDRWLHRRKGTILYSKTCSSPRTFGYVQFSLFDFVFCVWMYDTINQTRMRALLHLLLRRPKHTTTDVNINDKRSARHVLHIIS